MKKELLIILFCVTTLLSGCSQDFQYTNPLDPQFVGAIKGQITDSSTGQGMPLVLLHIDPSSGAVISDVNGNYYFENVRMGSYTITAMAKGYCGNEVNATVDSSEVTIANIVLTPSDIEMVPIPAGDFIMGSMNADPYCSSDEMPQHTVYLDAYQICKFEITNAQYKKFIDAGGYHNRNYWSTAGWLWLESYVINEPLIVNTNYPVTGISWYEAEAFCLWIGARLPTEAEWEKAARGNNSNYHWPWGYDWDSTKCNNICGTYNHPEAPPDTFTNTSPVGYFITDQSPYGVFDMSGNVSEWVNDWYSPSYYSVSPINNPAGPADFESNWCKVIRGGSFINEAGDCRSASRNWYYNNYDKNNIGFRAVK